MSGQDFEIESRADLASGVFLRLEQVTMVTPDGSRLHRDVVRHPGGAAVLPIDGDRAWFVRMFRVALGREIIEIPAGKLEVGDADPESAARRELSEEIGATAERWEHLVTIAPSPGYTEELVHVFMAEGLTFTERVPDGAEEVEAEVFTMPIEEALDRIVRGEITDAKTVVALLELNRRRP